MRRFLLAAALVCVGAADPPPPEEWTLSREGDRAILSSVSIETRALSGAFGRRLRAGAMPLLQVSCDGALHIGVAWRQPMRENPTSDGRGSAAVKLNVHGGVHYSTSWQVTGPDASEAPPGDTGPLLAQLLAGARVDVSQKMMSGSMLQARFDLRALPAALPSIQRTCPN